MSNETPVRKVTRRGAGAAADDARTRRGAGAGAADARAAEIARMTRLARLFQIASDKMDDAFGRLVGINPTDQRCLDLIDVHGGMTAGELAEAASLSPGAVTTVLDRLERMGLVTRTRDETDRRRVIVEMTDKARELAGAIYGPIGGYAAKYIQELSDEDIAVITRFLEAAIEVNERRAREVNSGEA
jgi:DNA-binding MarR family transcriptional regulator